MRNKDDDDDDDNTNNKQITCTTTCTHSIKIFHRKPFPPLKRCPQEGTIDRQPVFKSVGRRVPWRLGRRRGSCGGNQGSRNRGRGSAGSGHRFELANAGHRILPSAPEQVRPRWENQAYGIRGPGRS